MSTPVDALLIENKVVEAISSCYDPEIPVNIYDLGLIYGIDVDAQSNVVVRMTLTAPGCPAAQSLPEEVKQKVQQIPDVKSVKVDVVWEPAWTPDRMTEAAKLQLGMM